MTLYAERETVKKKLEKTNWQDMAFEVITCSARALRKRTKAHAERYAALNGGVVVDLSGNPVLDNWQPEEDLEEMENA